jgi:hypothetical protein
MGDKVEIEIEEDNSEDTAVIAAAEANAERANDAEERASDAVDNAEGAADESGESAQEAEQAASAATQAAVDAITSNAETQYSNQELMAKLDSLPDTIAAAIIAANSVQTQSVEPVVQEEIRPDDAPMPGHFWTRDIREVIGSMFRRDR